MTDRTDLQDITIAKLREHAAFLKHNVATWQLLGRAADEIERLATERAELALHLNAMIGLHGKANEDREKAFVELAKAREAAARAQQLLDRRILKE